MTLDGRDLHTGQVKRSVNLPDCIYTGEHHFRCYRGKATVNFLLDNKRGIEFLNLREDDHSKSDYIRGACRYGILPANGMLYSVPTPCSCYPTSQLDGFNALAPRLPGKEPTLPKVPVAPRLIQGPAYGKITAPTGNSSGDWPTYRADAMRTAQCKTRIAGDKPKRKWATPLSGQKLTPPVVAGKLLLVASGRELFALNADTGKKNWIFTADGRIDAPPTIHQGAVLFGCRDGWVYCLRGTDGEFAWRSRVAPNDSQIVSYEELVPFLLNKFHFC